MYKAVLIGATGMVGQELLSQLLQDRAFERVIILVRRPLGLIHPKLEERVIDFQNELQFEEAMQGGDIIFSAVGTTQKKVKGDIIAYRSIDEWIPTKAAEFGKKWGARCFLLISAIGANSQSKNFYLQLKGEVEEKIKKSGISSIYLFQPSLLLGHRTEIRIGEKLAQWIFPLFSWITPSRFRAVHGKDLAMAMIHFSKISKLGQHTLMYSDFFPDR